MNYPIYTRRIWRAKNAPTPVDINRHLDGTVAQRALAPNLRYSPSSLRPFRKALKDWAKEHPTA